MRCAKLLTIGLLLAACGGEDYTNAERERWCRHVEGVADRFDVDFSAMSSRELRGLLQEIERDLIAGAPPSIRDDLETLDELASDTLRISEQERIAKASVAVDAKVRDDCDLAVPLSSYL